MSDSVADKSGFLRMYMSSHPDTLVAYAKWYGKVKEQIVSAEMTAIDSKSMTLASTLKDGSKKDVKVVFEPPLAGYEDVKPRLLEMKALAQEGLGMIKAPKITTFALPPDALYSGIFVAVALYFRLFYAGSSPFSIPAGLLHSLVGGRAINYSFNFFLIAHVLESLYTLSLCRRHQTPIVIGAAYVFSTVIFGYPIWVSLRKRIQSMRIDSVMKIQ